MRSPWSRRIRVPGAASRARPPSATALGGEPEPASLTRRAAGGRRRASSRRSTPAEATSSSTGRRAAGRRRCTSRPPRLRSTRDLATIVLVPEIALTPQTVGRFRARFGDRVAVLHSALTEAERRDERARLSSGAARIVVGARSAIFAPVERPRARRRRRGARRVLQAGVGPALRRAHGRREAGGARGRGGRLRQRDAARGELGAARAAAAPRPDRRAASDGACSSTCGARPAIRSPRRSSPSSRRSRERGGRAILLLNRRGLSGAIHCRACGVTRRCPSCDIALTLHRDGRLHCHHCGYSTELPEACPECGSVELARIGAGTQRLEAELARQASRPRADPARRGHGRAARRAARGARAVLLRRARSS